MSIHSSIYLLGADEVSHFLQALDFVCLGGKGEEEPTKRKKTAGCVVHSFFSYVTV
jgi:hypothetical protein